MQSKNPAGRKLKIDLAQMQRQHENRALLPLFYEALEKYANALSLFQKTLKEQGAAVYPEDEKASMLDLDAKTWEQRTTTMNEAARLCGIKKTTVRFWVDTGEVRAYKQGRAWYVCVDDVLCAVKVKSLQP